MKLSTLYPEQSEMDKSEHIYQHLQVLKENNKQLAQKWKDESVLSDKHSEGKYFSQHDRRAGYDVKGTTWTSGRRQVPQWFDQPRKVPTHHSPYCVTQSHLDREKAETGKVMAKALTELGSTEWAQRIVLDTEMDVKLRFYIEYQKLNVIAVRDWYGITRIEKWIVSLGNEKMSSTLDTIAGYWNPEMIENAKTTVFAAHFGLLRSKSIPPFGLKSAPGRFSWLRMLYLRQWSGTTQT